MTTSQKTDIRLTLTIAMLCCISCMFQTTAHSQSLYFDNDPIWQISSSCAEPYPCIENNTFNYYVNGDTLINSHVYKKLFAKGTGYFIWLAPPPVINCQGNWTHNNAATPVGFVRDTLNKIYIYQYNFSHSPQIPFVSFDTLLYDFNLQVGDTLPLTLVNWNSNITVTAVDSVLIGTAYRKKFDLTSFGGSPAYMIEGIGHEGGFVEPFPPVFDCGYNLLCYGLGDSAYFPSGASVCELNVGLQEFTSNSMVSVYPNPANDQVTFDLNGVPTDLEFQLFSSTGQLVFSKVFAGPKFTIPRIGLSSGLYFYRISFDGNAFSGKVVFE